jgi:hypothetical protein
VRPGTRRQLPVAYSEHRTLAFACAAPGQQFFSNPRKRSQAAGAHLLQNQFGAADLHEQLEHFLAPETQRVLQREEAFVGADRNEAWQRDHSRSHLLRQLVRAADGRLLQPDHLLQRVHLRPAPSKQQPNR